MREQPSKYPGHQWSIHDETRKLASQPLRSFVTAEAFEASCGSASANENSLRSYRKLRKFRCNRFLRETMGLRMHAPTVLAFAAGVVITLACTVYFPGMDRRKLQKQASFKISASTNDPLNVAPSQRVSGIVDGVEGTIGNTPLIKIKSLSEETGCEILGKAEVRCEDSIGTNIYIDS